MDLDSFLFICIFIKLSGAQDVTTVRKVSVQRGQSVIIPCLYEQKYAVSEKCLSAGLFWILSDDIQRYHPKKVLISDDTSRNIFAVHIDGVQESAHYWCAVRVPPASDKRAEFILKVTAGPPMLYVTQQHVSGSENGRVTITCYHQGMVKPQSEVKWCKFAGRCVTGMFGKLDGASVEIRYDLKHMVVTMSGLTMENMGWYLCSTDELQMPVHITVHQIQTLVPEETDPIPRTDRKRTAIFILLPVILEILLIIIIYSTLKLLRCYKERCLKSANQAGENQYVAMDRKRSSTSYGSSAGEGGYEIMAVPKRNIECYYVNVSET